MWTAIAAALLKGLAALADFFRDRQLLEAGKATQKAEDLGAATEKVKEASDVEARVDRADADERDELRNKWTRGA